LNGARRTRRPRTIPPELLPVTSVRATHSQLAGRLGLAAKDLIGQRLRSAIDAGAIVRANPGAARSAGGEYQIVKTSAALAAGRSASTARPRPAAARGNPLADRRRDSRERAGGARFAGTSSGHCNRQRRQRYGRRDQPILKSATACPALTPLTMRGKEIIEITTISCRLTCLPRLPSIQLTCENLRVGLRSTACRPWSQFNPHQLKKKEKHVRKAGQAG
jgi:hypothetical protein